MWVQYHTCTAPSALVYATTYNAVWSGMTTMLIYKCYLRYQPALCHWLPWAHWLVTSKENTISNISGSHVLFEEVHFQVAKLTALQLP